MRNLDRRFVEGLLIWHKTHRRSFPWRDQNDPYVVFVAEFFLQKTPAERVALMFDDFLNEYPDVNSLAKADPTKIISKYSQLGLPKRIFWLVNSTRIVINEYEGKIPSTKKELEKLPGVGKYTSSAILCFAFNQRIAIVDSNVIRLFSRYFKITKTEIENKAILILPSKDWKTYNEALLDFSALLCKSKPMCEKDDVLGKNCFNRLRDP